MAAVEQKLPPGFEEDTNFDTPVKRQANGLPEGFTEDTGAGPLDAPLPPPDLRSTSIMPTVMNALGKGWQDLRQNPPGYMAAGASTLLSGWPAPLRALGVGGVGAASQVGKELGNVLQEHPDPTMTGGLKGAAMRVADQALGQGAIEGVAGKVMEKLNPAALIAKGLSPAALRESPHIPDTMLKYGANRTAGGAKKLQVEIDGINKEIQDLTTTHAGKTIHMNQALRPLQDLSAELDKQIAGGVTPATAAMRPVEKKGLVDAFIADMNAQHKTTVPIENIQNIKRELRKKAGEYGRQGGPGSTDAEQLHKMTISGLNDAMGQITGSPEIKERLKEEARLISARDAIEKSLSNNAGILPPGVARPLIGATVGAVAGNAGHGNEYRDPLATALGAIGGGAVSAMASPGNLARLINISPTVAKQAGALPARLALGHWGGAAGGGNEIWQKYNDYLDKRKAQTNESTQ